MNEHTLQISFAVISLIPLIAGIVFMVIRLMNYEVVYWNYYSIIGLMLLVIFSPMFFWAINTYLVSITNKITKDQWKNTT